MYTHITSSHTQRHTYLHRHTSCHIHTQRHTSSHIHTQRHTSSHIHTETHIKSYTHRDTHQVTYIHICKCTCNILTQVCSSCSSTAANICVFPPLTDALNVNSSVLSSDGRLIRSTVQCCNV